LTSIKAVHVKIDGEPECDPVLISVPPEVLDLGRFENILLLKEVRDANLRDDFLENLCRREYPGSKPVRLLHDDLKKILFKDVRFERFLFFSALLKMESQSLVEASYQGRTLVFTFLHDLKSSYLNFGLCELVKTEVIH